MNTSRRPAHWIATLIALIGAGLLIDGWHAARPLWVDEEMLALNVRDRSFAQFVGPLWLDQTAPFGWLVLERLAFLTFGPSERALRLVPLLFALGTLGIAVWIGRRWMSWVGAAVLLLLCSIGPWVVFFSLELKHYSADTFWALFLPALGAWALDAADTSGVLRRRVAVWWAVAAAGHWFSHGAAFVAPACALVLFIESWRRGGWRTASWMLVVGLGWVASIGLCYVLVLQHALGNVYLQTYWEFAFPPASAGVGGILRWLINQLEPLAIKPGGTGLWIMFWLASAVGLLFAVATRGGLGLMFATVPLSVAALAILRLVPPFERLALWAVPASYVGVGLCADAALWLGRRRSLRGRVTGLPLAVVAGAIVSAVCIDVAQNGRMEFVSRPRSNYGLDDRRSVRLLMNLRRPGDVLVTTHFGLPAIWWYGGLNISSSDRSGSWDGSPMFEVGHVPPGPACDQWKEKMDQALRSHSRIVVYLGFRLNVEPPGFGNLVLEEFGKRGALVGYRAYAEESRVAVFDMTQKPLIAPIIPVEAGRAGEGGPVGGGCVAIKAGRRSW